MKNDTEKRLPHLRIPLCDNTSMEKHRSEHLYERNTVHQIHAVCSAKHDF